jgi:adenosylhomocysteinase
MDMSFSNQAMAAAYLALNHAKLEKKVYDVPLEIDEEVATLKLSSMGVTIDELTPAQKKYMSSWSEGT